MRRLRSNVAWAPRPRVSGTGRAGEAPTPRFAVLAVIAIVMLVDFTRAQAGTTTMATRQVRKPTTVIASENCVTAECHVNVKKSRVTHGPVASNTCDACHQLTDAKQHRFAVVNERGSGLADAHFLVREQRALHVDGIFAHGARAAIQDRPARRTRADDPILGVMPLLVSSRLHLLRLPGVVRV